MLYVQLPSSLSVRNSMQSFIEKQGLERTFVSEMGIPCAPSNPLLLSPARGATIALYLPFVVSLCLSGGIIQESAGNPCIC